MRLWRSTVELHAEKSLRGRSRTDYLLVRSEVTRILTASKIVRGESRAGNLEAGCPTSNWRDSNPQTPAVKLAAFTVLRRSSPTLTAARVINCQKSCRAAVASAPDLFFAEKVGRSRRRPVRLNSDCWTTMAARREAPGPYGGASRKPPRKRLVHSWSGPATLARRAGIR